MNIGRREVPSWVAATLPTTIVCLTLAISYLAKSWLYLSGTHHLPDFLDLQQLTYTSGCSQTDVNWNLDSPSCDPAGRAYNYPSAWVRVLSAFKIDGSHTGMLGIAFILSYLCAIFTLSFSSRFALRDPLRLSVYSIAVITPPVWLAMDRGSTDIVILLMLIASALALAKSLNSLGILGISLATLLKLFSVGAYPAVFLKGKNRLRNLVFSLISLLIIAIILRPEVAKISVRTPRSSENSFGMAVIPIRLQDVLPEALSSGRAIGLLGISALLITALIWIILLRISGFRAWLHSFSNELTLDPVTLQLFFASAGAFLVAYAVGTNYDYRLIFLLPIIVAFLRLTGPTARSGIISAGILALTMLMSSQVRFLADLVDWLFLILVPMGLLIYGFVAFRVLHLSSRNADSPHS